MEESQDKKAKEASSPPTDIAQTLRALIVFAMAIAAVIIGLYFFQFHGKLSMDADQWGAFGDYLGGVLNPVFGFFALIALLFTIILQSRELAASREELKLSRKELANSAQALQDSKDIATRQAEHFETQARKEDVYRMIKDVYGELDSFYKTSKHVELHCWEAPKLANITIGHLHEFFGKNKRYYEFLVEADDELSKPNHDQINPLRQLLVELKIYLEQFERFAGNTFVTGYYKRRYRQVCIDMYGKRYLDVQTVDFYKSDDPVS